MNREILCKNSILFNREKYKLTIFDLLLVISFLYEEGYINKIRRVEISTLTPWRSSVHFVDTHIFLEIYSNSIDVPMYGIKAGFVETMFVELQNAVDFLTFKGVL